MSIQETLLAERLGLNRKVLLDIRKKNADLNPGMETDEMPLWLKTGKGIQWTHEGQKWLEEYLISIAIVGPDRGVESRDHENGAQEGLHSTHRGTTEVDAIPEPVRFPAVLHKELVVEKVYKKNRKLLLALDEEGCEQRVRVRSNEFFVKGQLIPCIHQQSNLWTLNGRCPKARGKLYRKVKQ